MYVCMYLYDSSMHACVFVCMLTSSYPKGSATGPRSPTTRGFSAVEDDTIFDTKKVSEKFAGRSSAIKNRDALTQHSGIITMPILRTYTYVGIEGSFCESKYIIGEKHL